VSFRIARDTQRNPVSNNKQKQNKKTKVINKNNLKKLKQSNRSEVQKAFRNLDDETFSVSKFNHGFPPV
jgi:ATP-dependent helicase/DNAse subunit B